MSDGHRRRGARYPKVVTCNVNGRVEKKSFRSAAKARQAAQKANHVAARKLRAYQCPACGLWHLTSQEQR